MTDSTTKTTHNLDQHMSDLRQIVAQGKKRIGILLGAGAPASINIGDNEHKPLIPMISKLTADVKEALPEKKELIDSVIANINKEKRDTDKKETNIEDILSKIRSISSTLKDFDEKMGVYSHENCNDTADAICKHIGNIVDRPLPNNKTPYNSLARWIGGAHREHAVEVFTTNYDLLMEEAFENAEIPFFTGFTGSYEPFFDTASIDNNDDLPSRWARLWKLHGSLGWDRNKKNEIICGAGRKATQLIYPDHLKYDATQKLPYVALLDRLKTFLREPDTLLLSCGFSYCDSHVSAVIGEALSANPKASVFAFMYDKIEGEIDAKKLAEKHFNFSTYANDKAIIGGIEGAWALGKNKNEDWKNIRDSFWGLRDGCAKDIFTLGDFVEFSKFLALSKAGQTYSLSDPFLALPPPLSSPTSNTETK